MGNGGVSFYAGRTTFKQVESSYRETVPRSSSREGWARFSGTSAAAPQLEGIARRNYFLQQGKYAKMEVMRFAAATIVLGVFLFAGSARAIVLGQVDNFEDNTLQNWANGGAPGVPPVLNINTGGPAGANDNFMQISSDGAGIGKFLTVFNRSQWLGDYIGTGVTAIEMDLRNLGSVSLTIRLAFKDAPGNGTPGYLSSQSFTLAVGSGWQHVVFLINPASMIAIGGPTAFNAFFAGGFQEMRIIDEVGTSNLNGDIITGQLGIDNIHAVPEPGAALLAVAGMLALVVVWRKRG
jgi:hypothetical protein